MRKLSTGTRTSGLTTQQRARSARPDSASGQANSLKVFERLKAAAQRFPQETRDERQGEAMAFKLALPGLGSASEIREYIGAVAQGIALGFFTGREGSQLLYAAQIALSAETQKRSKVDRTDPKKSVQCRQPESTQ